MKHVSKSEMDKMIVCFRIPREDGKKSYFVGPYGEYLSLMESMGFVVQRSSDSTLMSLADIARKDLDYYESKGYNLDFLKSKGGKK